MTIRGMRRHWESLAGGAAHGFRALEEPERRTRSHNWRWGGRRRKRRRPKAAAGTKTAHKNVWHVHESLPHAQHSTVHHRCIVYTTVELSHRVYFVLRSTYNMYLQALRIDIILYVSGV